MSQEPPNDCKGESLCVCINRDTVWWDPGSHPVRCQNPCCLSWVWPPAFHSWFPCGCWKVRAECPGPTRKHSPIQLHPAPRTFPGRIHATQHDLIPISQPQAVPRELASPHPHVMALEFPGLDQGISWRRIHAVPPPAPTSSSATSASPGYGAAYCTL